MSDAHCVNWEGRAGYFPYFLGRIARHLIVSLLQFIQYPDVLHHLFPISRSRGLVGVRNFFYYICTYSLKNITLVCILLNFKWKAANYGNLLLNILFVQSSYFQFHIVTICVFYIVFKFFLLQEVEILGDWLYLSTLIDISKLLSKIFLSIYSLPAMYMF